MVDICEIVGAAPSTFWLKSESVVGYWLLVQLVADCWLLIVCAVVVVRGGFILGVALR